MRQSRHEKLITERLAKIEADLEDLNMRHQAIAAEAKSLADQRDLLRHILEAGSGKDEGNGD